MVDHGRCVIWAWLRSWSAAEAAADRHEGELLSAQWWFQGSCLPSSSVELSSSHQRRSDLHSFWCTSWCLVWERRDAGHLWRCHAAWPLRRCRCRRCPQKAKVGDVFPHRHCKPLLTSVKRLSRGRGVEMITPVRSKMVKILPGTSCVARSSSALRIQPAAADLPWAGSAGTALSTGWSFRGYRHRRKLDAACEAFSCVVSMVLVAG